jgi:phosphatidyl-myo-inositol dimannoside synthase
LAVVDRPIDQSLVRGDRRRGRVLVVSPDFPPAVGGIQRLLGGVLKNLALFEAHLVTCEMADSVEFDRNQPFTIRRTRGAPFLGHAGTMGILNLIGALEARGRLPDVLLNAHVVTAPAAVVVSRLLGIPYVQYLYGHELTHRRGLAGLAVRNAQAVIAISRHTARLAVERGADPGRIAQIEPGVDLPPVTKRRRGTRPTVITIGRLVEHYKGHDVLMEAIAMVRERIPDVLWVVIGEGPLRRGYEQMAGRLGLDHNIAFLGSVNDVEKDAWLDRADVMAMPSRLPPGGGGDGFGIVYLEAGAHCLPVVAGNTGGPSEAVVGGETGLLVDPTDARAVAEALTQLLVDSDTAAVMGRAGRAWAEKFSWRAVSQRVEEVLLRTWRGES